MEVFAHTRVVRVRCCRCRRIIGRLADGWFQPKHPLASVTTPLPPVFRFPGYPDPLLHGRPMKGVTVIPLDRMTIEGLYCGCRKRDGTQTTCTLNLLWMGHASWIDERIHDLIAGEPDYGLTGIHDELEYTMASQHGRGSVTPEMEAARRASDAERGDDLMRRIQNRGRRKTRGRGGPGSAWAQAERTAAQKAEAASTLLEWSAHTDTDDPADRA